MVLYSLLYNFLVCFSVSFIITEMKVAEPLRKLFTLMHGKHFIHCIVCVGFWVAVGYNFFVEEFPLRESIEISCIYSVMNLLAKAVFDWAETSE